MLKIARPEPKKIAVGKKAAAPAKAAPRRRYEDDDDDDEPKGKAAPREEREAPAKHAATKGGWGAADQQKETSFETRFTKNLQIKHGEEVVFKFLEDAPFAAIKVHWVEKKGKKSYICPETPDCPLCLAGVKVEFEARFNVAVLTEEEPLLRSFVVKSRRYEEVKAYNKAQTGPLTKKWYAFSRTGSTMNDTRYKLELIRRTADITDDYPTLAIPDSEVLEALDLYTKDDVDAERPSMKELREVAADVSSGGYDEE